MTPDEFMAMKITVWDDKLEEMTTVGTELLTADLETFQSTLDNALDLTSEKLYMLLSVLHELAMSYQQMHMMVALRLARSLVEKDGDL